jgi:DNA-binding transcriptional ArsR family regulator
VHDLLAVSKALSDATRVRLLAACVHAADASLAADVCACQLIELVGLAPSTVSRHLAVLRDAGLVTSRRDGKWIYYAASAAPDSPRPVQQAIDLTREAIASTGALQRDAASLRAILALDPEELCRTQRPSDSACCSSAPATPAEARWPKDGPARSRPTPSKRTRRARTPTD